MILNAMKCEWTLDKYEERRTDCLCIALEQFGQAGRVQCRNRFLGWHTVRVLNFSSKNHKLATAHDRVLLLLLVLVGLHTEEKKPTISLTHYKGLTLATHTVTHLVSG